MVTFSVRCLTAAFACTTIEKQWGVVFASHSRRCTWSVETKENRVKKKTNSSRRAVTSAQLGWPAERTVQGRCTYARILSLSLSLSLLHPPTQREREFRTRNCFIQTLAQKQDDTQSQTYSRVHTHTQYIYIVSRGISDIRCSAPFKKFSFFVHRDLSSTCSTKVTFLIPYCLSLWSIPRV